MSSASRRTALVTGGAGFLGSHVTDALLEQDFFVRVLDNFATGKERNLARHTAEPRLSVERLDIRACQPGCALFAGVDVVLHLAGIGEIVPSIERPLDYISTNAQGTAHVADCARRGGVRRIVYAASSSCYGLAATPTNEDHPISPQYPYALSKYLGEQILFHWGKVYGLEISSLRLFNAYGPRSLTSGAYGAVFGVFLKQRIAGRPFTVVGDGTQTRDFVFATDVADAFARAATAPVSGRIWNIGGGNPQSVNRLVQLLGGGDVINLPARPGEPDCTWADITRAGRDLDWRPKVTFEQGVTEVLANIDHWIDAPLWDEASIAKATSQWFAALGRAERS